MPSPAKCAAKFKVGSKEYKDCIAYKNQSPVKGRARQTKGPASGGRY